MGIGEVGDPNDAYLETEAPDTYGTELAVGVDRACLLTDNGLSWGTGAGTRPRASSGYARHFCALDSECSLLGSQCVSDLY